MINLKTSKKKENRDFSLCVYFGWGHVNHTGGSGIDTLSFSFHIIQFLYCISV